MRFYIFVSYLYLLSSLYSYVDNMQVFYIDSILFDFNKRIIKNWPNISIPPINILENKTMQALMKTAKNAHFNRKTGNFYFLPITVDRERIVFATQQFCSLIKTGFPKEAIIYISYDEGSCHILNKHGANCEVVNIVNVPTLNNKDGKFRMKVYLLYLQNYWHFDAYTLDSDVIFIENIEKAFYNENIDLEISSNDNRAVSQINASKSKQPNSGFGRFLPTAASRDIINDILERAQTSSGRDQAIHSMVYNKWRGNNFKISNGIETWMRNVKFRIIDPLLVANGGVALCTGRNEYWKQIEIKSKNKYKMPVALHFNWDVFNKTLTYQKLGLNMCKKLNAKMVRKFKKEVFKINCVSLWGCNKCYVHTLERKKFFTIFF